MVDGDTYASQIDAINAGLTGGMVAKIYGGTDANGLTGSANWVIYDDDVEGPVTQLIDLGESQRSFEIFGQIIIVDLTSTRFKNTTFSGLQDNDILEVSGFHASSTEIMATFVKKNRSIITR